MSRLVPRVPGRRTAEMNFCPHLHSIQGALSCPVNAYRVAISAKGRRAIDMFQGERGANRGP